MHDIAYLVAESVLYGAGHNTLYAHRRLLTDVPRAGMSLVHGSPGESAHGPTLGLSK